MYRKCVTEVSVQHQKQVEDALLELMRKMPYEDITVTTLCRAAGLSRRVFYHLFANKSDALLALIDHRILASGNHDTVNGDEVLRFFRYWKEQQPLLDALQANRQTGLLLERMIENAIREEYDLRYWLKRNGWEKERDLIVFYFTGAMGLIYRWYYGGFRETPEEMAQLLNRILTVPLVGNSSK